jgi:hypothetical protein
VDQSGLQGVSFDVPANQQKVFIILAGKTLETAPIDMSVATGPVVGMQPHRVRERNPPQEVAHASIFRGLQHKMRVVRH